MALDEVILEKIKKEYEEGILSKQEIARKFGINRKSVYNWSNKHNWVYGKQRSSKRFLKAENLDQLPFVSSSTADELSREYVEATCAIRQLILQCVGRMQEAMDQNFGSKQDAIKQYQGFLKSLRDVVSTLDTIQVGQAKAFEIQERKNLRKTGHVQSGVLLVPGTTEDISIWQEQTQKQQQELIEGDESATGLDTSAG